MANTTNLTRTCGDCTFRNHNYCVKTKNKVQPIQYACNRHMTDQEWNEEKDRMVNERLERNETRLNFILTALAISATSTQMLMEYFDSLFEDHMVERDWRFARKKAANDIRAAAEKMRKLYQHTFMADQNTVFTKQGKKAYDAEAYDLHERDARQWCLKLFYELDRCWQDIDKEKAVLDFYKAMPDNNTFDDSDYRHFAK